MNGGLARMITLASCAVGMLAVSHGAEPGTSTAASSPLPVGGGDRLNIDLVKSLDGTGGYIRLEGRSLFLTSNVNPKAQQAGFWFDIGPDPAAPALLKKSLPGAWDVATVGDHAFVCDYTKSLTVCDLRKHQWQQVAKLDMPSMTENIALRGTLAYVANHTAGLTIVSIAEPSKPSIVSNFNPRIDCDGLALWGDFAVLYGHAQSRLVLVDVTDPAKPRQIGVYQHDKGSFNQGEVDADGGWAYCTSVNGQRWVCVRSSRGQRRSRAGCGRPGQSHRTGPLRGPRAPHGPATGRRTGRSGGVSRPRPCPGHRQACPRPEPRVQAAIARSGLELLHLRGKCERTGAGDAVPDPQAGRCGAVGGAGCSAPTDCTSPCSAFGRDFRGLRGGLECCRLGG
jgi:hypothetical protein